jgi:acetylornithine deacetylase
MARPDPVAIEMIRTLVGFDTTSRESNLGLIELVRDHLRRLGVEPLLVYDAQGAKANLYATLGPQDRPGIMLSGHTDVVPIDGQDWSSDPFTLTERDGRLYGRGASDMKSFIALVLVLVPELLARRLATPIHLAFSYDEEVGCAGVKGLIEKLAAMPVRPRLCIVGEPTEMQVIIGHKGGRGYRVHVRGREAHSSLAPRAVNAVEYAAELIAAIRAMARQRIAEGPFEDGFDVPHTTLQASRIEGGTAINIVPKDCRFEFEFRNIAAEDPEALIGAVTALARDRLEPEMKARAPESFIDIAPIYAYPGLATRPDAEVVALVKALAGRNDHAKVAFGTEAGLFTERLGIPAVICGPGSIEQAHKPDEFIALDQVAKGEAFLRRLMDHVSA